MHRELYGGAISCEISEGFADVSEFRQVPDNQEVFAEAVSDRCVIIELLQLDTNVEDGQTAHYYFNEIANTNACSANDRCIIQAKELLDADVPNVACSKYVVFGTQQVSKFKEGEEAKNGVLVLVACLRLPQVQTDLVISVTTPISINPRSSSSSSVDNSRGTDHTAGIIILENVLKSLVIHDWSLFR